MFNSNLLKMHKKLAALFTVLCFVNNVLWATNYGTYAKEQADQSVTSAAAWGDSQYHKNVAKHSNVQGYVSAQSNNVTPASTQRAKRKLTWYTKWAAKFDMRTAMRAEQGINIAEKGAVCKENAWAVAFAAVLHNNPGWGEDVNLDRKYYTGERLRLSKMDTSYNMGRPISGAMYLDIGKTPSLEQSAQKQTTPALVVASIKTTLDEYVQASGKGDTAAVAVVASKLGLSAADKLVAITAEQAVAVGKYLVEQGEKVINCAVLALKNLFSSSNITGAQEKDIAVTAVIVDILTGNLVNRIIGNTDNNEQIQLSMYAMIKTAENYGVTLNGYDTGKSLDVLKNAFTDENSSVIAHLNKDNGIGHYVTVTMKDGNLVIMDNVNKNQISLDDFVKQWDGKILAKGEVEGATVLTLETLKNTIGADVDGDGYAGADANDGGGSFGGSVDGSDGYGCVDGGWGIGCDGPGDGIGYGALDAANGPPTGGIPGGIGYGNLSIYMGAGPTGGIPGGIGHGNLFNNDAQAISGIGHGNSINGYYDAQAVNGANMGITGNVSNVASANTTTNTNGNIYGHSRAEYESKNVQENTAKAIAMYNYYNIEVKSHEMNGVTLHYVNSSQVPIETHIISDNFYKSDAWGSQANLIPVDELTNIGSVSRSFDINDLNISPGHTYTDLQNGSEANIPSLSSSDSAISSRMIGANTLSSLTNTGTVIIVNLLDGKDAVPSSDEIRYNGNYLPYYNYYDYWGNNNNIDRILNVLSSSNK